MLIDSHCHLTSGKLAEQVEQVLLAARQAGVGLCVSAGSDMADSRAALDLARRHAEVFCSAGVHTHEAEKTDAHYLQQLEEIILAGGDRCVAVGEIGLDYHYDFSPRDIQRRVFLGQLELAARLGKPIIVHTREASEDSLGMLKEFSGRVRGVIHSFTGDAAEVRRFLDQGWCIGFSGIVTFKNSQPVREAAQLVPSDRLLVETDAPYLSPEPVRKIHPNTPANVAHIARCLAEDRGVPPEALADQTTANAVGLFKLHHA